MEEQKFFICNHCKNLVSVVHDSSVPMICCGEPMQLLVPNISDGATEKHVPIVSAKERLVHISIGSVMHPMIAEHHIEFIYLQTAKGGQLKRLSLESEPAEIFAVLNDEPVGAYAYCNLHGLWKTEILDEHAHDHCHDENCHDEHCNHEGCNHDHGDDQDEHICSAEFAEGCK